MSRVADFNYKYDYAPVLLWQYSNAPNLRKIIENEQSFLDIAITQFKEEFDHNIFNLSTCDANGLDLWGRILGVQRPVLTGGVASNEQYRLLLQSRFFVLIWDGSGAGLAEIIKSLFPNALFKIEDCPLDENDDPEYMTVNIDFASGLSDEEIAILQMGYIDETSGEYVYTFLPRPAGVTYNLSFEGQWAKTLGFEGMTEIIDVGGTPTLKDGSTTNMGGAYDCSPDDETGETGTENPDGGVFYK